MSRAKIISVRNVNTALPEALRALQLDFEREQTRNGPVHVFPGPVITEYGMPLERVLFSPKRNANPFFHCMEAIWMLAGRDDVAFPMIFNSQIANYSDNGKIFHGAYGYRWRNHFGMDQIVAVVRELSDHPESRRAVIGMWDVDVDLGRNGKDLPCNTHAYFDIRGGFLNMTVCNRSNDAIWGAYGANVVHFSMLQEYIAFCVGVGVGTYTQVSNNLHVYVDKYPAGTWTELILDCESNDRYVRDGVRPVPLIAVSAGTFRTEIGDFCVNPAKPREFREPFIENVLKPMYLAWRAKDVDPTMALFFANEIAAPDWKIACGDWLRRRIAKREEKAA